MRRESQHNVMLLIGVMLLQTGWTGLHLRYVKAGMQPLLVAGGALLLVIGGLGLLRSLRAGGWRQPLADGDEHRPPATAWLIVLPLLVLVVAVPPSLGAFAAAREPTRIEQPAIALAPLDPPRDGAVDLSVTEYASRELFDPRSLASARIRLVGFVTVTGGQWYVTRIRLSCCAADGRPVKVLAQGAAAPETNTWVEVVGTLPAGLAPQGTPGQVPTISIESVRSVAQPRQTYES